MSNAPSASPMELASAIATSAEFAGYRDAVDELVRSRA